MNSKNKKRLSAFALGATALGLAAVYALTLTEDFDADAQPIGYVAQPAASSSVVSSGNEKLYMANYSSVGWTGNLHSYNLTASGSASNTDNWEGGAAKQINAQHFNTGRMIVTVSGSAGIPFKWGSISAEQKGLLDAGTLTTAASSPILDYIRGDISKQADQKIVGPYRARTSILGDIIHSTPVYWVDKAATPNKTIFVGANDGMLHAINADTGKERFAYIPSMLMYKLGELTKPDYSHKYYVDGRLAISTFRGAGPTILAGTLGAGGKGLFALNVTTAAASSEADAAAKILWERTNDSAGFGNLGYTYGAPILKILPGVAKALVVANGYFSKDGKASLFIINAETGELIKEIVTDSAGSATSPNGLSTPSFVDTDNNGTDDTAYAGDLDGNLWKFDLVTNKATKLFTTDSAQSITTAPGVMRHPLGGVMVTFVTGRMLFTKDASDTATHYAYGIWDNLKASTDSPSLLEQTLSETTLNGIKVRTASNNVPDSEKTYQGWKTTLPVGGERMVGDGAGITDGVFQFTTTNPAVATTAAPPGQNWWMKLDALTGGENSKVQFDLNNDGAFNNSDKVPGATAESDAKAPVGKQLGGGASSQTLQLSLNGQYIYHQSIDRGFPTPTDVIVRGVAGGHFDVDLYNSEKSVSHTHVYDDKYDVTGVNMLNASNANLNLSTRISTSTKFKVLAQNQYLSPAVSIHIGDPNYKFNEDKGYIPIKKFITETAAEFDLAKVPSYTLGTDSNVKSLVINMPVDAFQQKDWWGGALGLPKDVRVGLHPTQTNCVKDSGAPMYKPISPPTTVTADGNGKANDNGLRHNGALVIQVISDTTPMSAIEMSVDGQPQYGWRLKSANLKDYLLAEYSIFWHHPNKLCYGAMGWTKLAPQDPTSDAKPLTQAAGSTDPKIGSFGVTPTTPGTYTSKPVDNGNGTSTTTITVVTVDTNGNTTTTITEVTTYNNGTRAEVVRSSPGTGPSLPLGRINWRELQQ